ncbi:RICIN domain-containing protein [Amycolatopsis nivea]|uniref:RICIN domain-containing protein n=1 Tax=Amycolatopsis nivea TaxID=1644109 RepID=UPI0034DF8568
MTTQTVAAAEPPAGIPHGARHLKSIEVDQIYSRLNGKCLDADTGTINKNGTKIQVWDCNQYMQQRWRLNWGQTSNYANVFSSRCLEVNPNLSDKKGNGAALQLWDCNGASWQDWWYVSGDNSLHNVYSGRCMDVDPARANQNGTVIYLWDCNGATQQKWLYGLLPSAKSPKSKSSTAD